VGFVLKQQPEAIDKRLLAHVLMDSKGSSLTQPGRGIRKIIDLYHDVHDLVHKAKVHSVRSRLNPRELAEVDSVDFVGLTKDQIEEEHKEYCDALRALRLTLVTWVTDTSASAASVATQPSNF